MDKLYSVDDDKLASLRARKPWVHDPKYCKKVLVSPSATIKMIMHGQSGVERGIKGNGKPIEVMGLLLGHLCTEDPSVIILSDAQPLPIEGMETRVIADDESVLNYMIALGDMNEQFTKDIFCGWYHTHPFEVDVNSHCYLSGTDVSTQLQWQRAEDPHGNPWVSIVIDPLRSLHMGKPEMMAFRVYPPDYSAPADQVPDGSIITNDKLRLEKWGACWNRYYKLEMNYYMSTLAVNTFDVLKNNFLWMNAFLTSSTAESQKSSAENVNALVKKLEYVEIPDISTIVGHVTAERNNRRRQHEVSQSSSESTSVSITKVEELAAGMAIEKCQLLTNKLAKNELF